MLSVKGAVLDVDDQGRTPLMAVLADREPDVTIIQMLLQVGAKVAIADKQCQTPLGLTRLVKDPTTREAC